MVPLIDVMLVLLVIFIVTAPLLTHAVKLDLPKASSQANELQARQDRVRDRRRRRALLERRAGDARRGRRSASPPQAQKQPQPEIHLRADQARRLPLRRRDAGRRVEGGPDEDRLRQRARGAEVTRAARSGVPDNHPRHEQRRAGPRADAARAMSTKLIRGYEVVIGLETHAQLSTASKIFSGASTALRRRAEHAGLARSTWRCPARCRC